MTAHQVFSASLQTHRLSKPGSLVTEDHLRIAGTVLLSAGSLLIYSIIASLAHTHTHSQSITSDEDHTLLLSSTKCKRIYRKFNLHKFSKNNNQGLTNHFQTLLFEARDSNSSCSQFLKSWHFKGQDFISATAKLLFWIPATSEEDNHLFHSVCINSCLFGQKLVKSASAEVLKSVSIYAGGKK